MYGLGTVAGRQQMAPRCGDTVPAGLVILSKMEGFAGISRRVPGRFALPQQPAGTVTVSRHERPRITGYWRVDGK